MEGPVKEVESYRNMDSLDLKPDVHSGILPRIAVFINHEIKRLQASLGKSITYKVSALEIYCENIRDLLSSSENHYLEIKNIKNEVVCPG